MRNSSLRVFVESLKSFTSVLGMVGLIAATIIAGFTLTGTFHPKRGPEQEAFFMMLAGLGILKMTDMCGWLLDKIVEINERPAPPHSS